MFKKLLIILIIFVLIIGGLQVFGGRDFTQISLALDKYSQSESLGEFVTDIGRIFSGKTVNESVFPSSRDAEKVLYRWVDELGVAHLSERRPESGDYKEIKLGDLEIQVEPGMSQEEINAILQLDKK